MGVAQGTNFSWGKNSCPLFHKRNTQNYCPLEIPRYTKDKDIKLAYSVFVNERVNLGDGDDLSHEHTQPLRV